MIDAEQECPCCGDPGPPHTVTVPLNPDAPVWDLFSVTLWQCRVCAHRYSRAAVVAARRREAITAEPPLVSERAVRTAQPSPRYL